MTVAADVPSFVQIPGNGTATSFAFPFKIFQASDLIVGFITSTGYGQQTSGFSVQNVDVNGGGNIVFTTPPPSGTTVDIRSVTPKIQNTEFANLGSFLPESHTEAFDRLTRMVQDLYRLAYTFGIHGPDQEGTAWTALPIASQRKNNALMFDSNGLPTIGTLVSQALTQSLIGQFLYPQTSAEIAAGVTPVNYAYAPGNVLRYGTNTTPGTTDMAAGIQAAIDSASHGSSTVKLADNNGLSKPLLLRTTTVDSLNFEGDSHVETVLEALTVNIATAPINVNALIICQSNALHCDMRKLRCASEVAYTGTFVYAVNGGGADGSVQAFFSAVIEDCWFSFGSTNSGIFYGTFSNVQMSNCTIETSKTGVMRLAGNGNSDLLFSNISMFDCYDSFIYGQDDTDVKAFLTVKGLHAYSHNRGPIIALNNAQDVMVSDVIVEANTGNLGTVGLFLFQDCSLVNVSKANCHSRAGVPQADGPAITITNGFTGKFSQVISDCKVGVQFTGAGVVDATFEDCDFSGSATTPINIGLQILGSTQSGRAVFKHCRFNSANAQCFIHSTGANTMSWEFIECEFVDAGLSGTGVDYNVDIALSADVRFVGCKFGQDNAAAAATHYMNANGAGTVEVIDPNIIGAVPGGGLFYTGTQSITFDGVDSSMPGMPQFVPSVGGSATYTLQNGTWSLKNKTLNFQGALTINAIGTGSQSVISGLPFTSAPATYGGGGGAINYFTGLAASYVSLQLFVDFNSALLKIRGLTAAGASNANQNALTSGSAINFSGQYRVYT